MPAGILAKDLEAGPPLHLHDAAATGGKGVNGKAGAEPEPVTDQFQPFHPRLGTLPEGPSQEPAVPQRAKAKVFRQVCQRRAQGGAGARKPLDQDAGRDIVAPDGKLVGPGVQRIVDVAVDDHIRRKGSRRQPARSALLQQRQPRLKAPLHAPCLSVRIETPGQEESRRKKDHRQDQKPCRQS